MNTQQNNAVAFHSEALAEAYKDLLLARGESCYVELVLDSDLDDGLGYVCHSHTAEQ